MTGTIWTTPHLEAVSFAHEFGISRGRALDNAFIARLRRTVKYEEIYLNHYDGVRELGDRLTAWFDFHCNRRRHSALNYRCPAELFFGSSAAEKKGSQRA